ncbi:hypothetical protein B0H14DRAFT_2565499 [Mycena olivaceomarginata]|nr:hypothetical protein B0H14DRAFT_2565499 [Mycena olivaceomarginata]
MSRGNQRELGTGFTENVPKRGESGPRLLYRTAVSITDALRSGMDIPARPRTRPSMVTQSQIPKSEGPVPDPESGPYVYITGPFFRPLQTIPPEAKENGNDKVRRSPRFSNLFLWEEETLNLSLGGGDP